MGMSAAHVPAGGALSGTASPQLRGGWLVLARTSWGALLVATLALFAIALPARVDQLRGITVSAAHVLRNTPGHALPGPLQEMLSPRIYTVALIALESLLLGAFLAAALA